MAQGESVNRNFCGSASNFEFRTKIKLLPNRTLILMLQELYDRREYVLKYISVAARDFVPTCAAPESLAEESWDMLGDDVFACTKEDLSTLQVQGDSTPADAPLGSQSEQSTAAEPQDKTEDSVVNVLTSLVSVAENSAEIRWILDDRDELCEQVQVQYHDIGRKDATQQVVPVHSKSNSYTMRNLRAETQYKVCVLPATRTAEVLSRIVSPDQCVQFVTQGKSDRSAVDMEKASNRDTNFQLRVPDSDDIAAFSKLIGFSFLVSVLLTGALMFVYEVLVFGLRLFFDRSDKVHTQ